MASEVVKTIMSQLGRGFSVMTGAKNFIQVKENELMFSIGRNAKSINRVRITYNYGTDLYDMKFCRVRMNHKTYEYVEKVVAEVNDVFCDTMLDVIEHNTGLITRMPRIVGFNC